MAEETRRRREESGSKHGSGENHGGPRVPLQSEVTETGGGSPRVPGTVPRQADDCERKVPETVPTPGAGREADAPPDGPGGPLHTALPESR